MTLFVELTEGERRLMKQLEECDFTGNGCCPSQDTLAEFTGYTRQHVNRCIKGLERKGMIAIAKERRAGSKWTHNVYQLACWNPNRRTDVLAKYAVLKRRRNARCDTEGPARPVVDDHSPSTGTSTYWFTNHCGRERASNCGAKGFGSANRGSRMEQQRGCARCGELETFLKKAEADLVDLGEQLAGRELQLRRSGQAEVALRNQLKAATASDDEAGDEARAVRSILVHWRDSCKGGSKRVAIGADGERAKLVRRALRSLTTGPLEERVQQCLDAVSGLALRPYVGAKGRVAHGGTRRDDVRYALMDEQHIEEHRGYWLRAQGSDVARKFEAWQGIARVAERHFELWRVASREAALARLHVEAAESGVLFGERGAA